MEKYIQLVQKLYMEPKDEDILGSFLQVETTGTDDVAKVPRAVSEPKKRKNKSEVQTKDIRNFFERNSKQKMHHLHKRARSDQTSKEKVVVLEETDCMKNMKFLREILVKDTTIKLLLCCLELYKKKLLQISKNWYIWQQFNLWIINIC